MPQTSNVSGKKKVAPKPGKRASEPVLPPGFSVEEFRRRLSAWYRENARELPWRGIHDPYATWLSEIMLQQTRVATVIERYKGFLLRFPTIGDLAAADEADVLALWSGLGYYQRARLLHRGAQFVEREMQGKLPRTAAELRRLPGVGDYTAAAIASIAFGESVAVLDGNVERVLLRLRGEPEEKSAQTRTRLVKMAQVLVAPEKSGRKEKVSGEKAPGEESPDEEEEAGEETILPGEHNQAMMELGATICLPRSPLCLQCPVVDLCITRGEHSTMARRKMQSRSVAHLLALRKQGIETEVLLVRRAKEASLMAGMLELPALPLEAAVGLEPAMRLRHAITNTNYYVQIFTENVLFVEEDKALEGDAPAGTLMKQIPAAKADLVWMPTTRLEALPLTGLARKALQRLKVMSVPRLKIELE